MPSDDLLGTGPDGDILGSGSDLLGAGTGTSPPSPPPPSPFRPEPAAFVPGAQWVNLVNGGITVSAAIAVPTASYLSPTAVNNGLTGPQDGAVIFLAGTLSTHDGGQCALFWDAASVATADNITVFNPWLVTGTPGRWVRFEDSTFVKVPKSAGPQLSNAIVTPLAALAIGPGVFDVFGTAYFASSLAGVVTKMSALLTPDIAAFNVDNGDFGAARVSFTAGGTAFTQALPVGPVPIVTAVPLVVQLYLQVEFGSGTVIGYGNIIARRVL